MQKQRLGDSGLEVSAIGLGCKGMTGKIGEDTVLDKGDFRNSLPRFLPEARKANQVFVDLVSSLASKKSATPAQIALAWIMAKRPWFVSIPGTTRLSRLEEIIGAAAITLTPEDLHEINNAAMKISVQGARYPEHLERMTGR